MGRTAPQLIRTAEDCDPDWLDRNLAMLKSGLAEYFQRLSKRDHEEQEAHNMIKVVAFFSCFSYLFLYDQCAR
jgi:hypothetical protein